jgi:hypothetical protein
MMLHVVLFTPRADLTAVEQRQFAAALERALGGIPSVRRYRVGRRIRTGAAYDALPGSYDYCGVLEFDDLSGLEAYLRHPAHAGLGQLFYTASAAAFAGDFDAVGEAPSAALQSWLGEAAG